MIEFEDVEIEKLDLNNIDDLLRLVVEYLCGEKYYQPLIEDESTNWLLKRLIDNVRKEGLNYEQLNELLLLLNQDRIGQPFFNFFFEKDKISLEDLKSGVIKFRGFAMLCFGNFRFAYKQLIQKNKSEFKDIRLARYSQRTSDLENEFKDRPPKMLDIEKIKRENTWYLGHISGAELNKEIEILNNEFTKIQEGESVFEKTELLEFEEKLLEMKDEALNVAKEALKNTDIYLTWDYMDIYVATSMRNKWEFEETYDFIESVFTESNLKNFKLRVFDPTQSKGKNPRDKGLIEGLMLKRALCTIYLAQETDTIGKDSELAATLAQSKPVIAYVPKHDPSEYVKKIEEFPLSFFKKRLLILKAEETFSDPELRKKIEPECPDFETIIDDFLKRVNTYRYEEQPFSLWFEKDNENFKKKYEHWEELCKILAEGECYNFEKRAGLLKGRHPLSMQIDLQSGVANGVLVVRSTNDCVELLNRILTNSMQFKIWYQDKEDEKFTILEEKVSSSPFRVITDYERLTNSFWNLFRKDFYKE